jgi:phage-related tail protein
MASERQSGGRSQSSRRTTGGNGEDQGRAAGLVSGAQDAAQKVRTAAGDVAERVPAAATSAQAAVTETAKTLDELPDQTLMLGAAFSLGMGVGMFVTGTNRLVVLLSMVPAAAMAATLLNREAEPPV